ncbi:DUF7286 family protein [Halorussus marinus]|uniref:DUF7286 family protein n=1 Tax=Halorussus marinus TaxID=2505976 RepID=UPI00106DE4C9|nr:hypothetical protein [Halorussus marinus]
MRLADDRRGRVPFALVGVVLLVGSAGLSATLAGGPAPEVDRSVGVAVERTTAASSTALRGAVARAGRAAARDPVVAPAETPAGRVLNDSAPYRDYLRVRIYLAARAALDDVAVRANGVRGTASLPAVGNASALGDAKRRVEIAAAGDSESAGLRVRIRNVTVVASRDGRAVERAAVSPTLVVATPALALHERVERFESRLERGPLAPGLGRRLTARLYAVAWARGYAQRGGAPIENVVANRHLELAANGALVREQRAAFGRSDPAARGALAMATARTGLTDLLAGAHNQRGSRATELLTAGFDRYRSATPLPGGPATDAPERPPSRTVAVNRTADRAFASFVADETDEGFDATLRSAYAPNVRVVTATRTVRDGRRPSLDSPGGNWTLRERRVETTTRVERADGPRPASPGGWHLLAHEIRRVVRAHALVGEWTRDNDSRTTVQRWADVSAVGVGLAGDHRGSVGPDRPIRHVHERGGALDGPNLRGVAETATERLIRDRGGFDAAARRAVDGRIDARSASVAGRRPSELRPWLYRDLAGLRERVRNVSAAVARTATVADGRPPAAALAGELRSRRAALLDVPERYDGVADRARVAARAAYLDRTVARLDARANRTRETRAGLDGALADAGVDLDRARRILADRGRPATPPAEPMAAAGPGAPANLTVAGAPPYLTLAELDREQVAAIPEGETRHPLAARNLNVFSVPYGDAADAVASVLDGATDRSATDLRTAGLALRAANRTLDAVGNETLDARRDRLRAEASRSLRALRARLVAELATAGLELTAAERRRAVRAGFDRWDTTAGRALAAANGSAADGVVAELLAATPSLRVTERRDWTSVTVELALEDARSAVDGPSRSTVSRTRSVARDLARDALADAGERAADRARERWFGEVLSSVPAGLPVAPVPGYWYATLNVWDVSVRGAYERFAVRAPTAAAGAGDPDGAVTYTRRNQTVEFDVDADGAVERLGRTTRVSFETETVVVVVVPPGAPGVGDTDGNADERSPGWSIPRPARGG